MDISDRSAAGQTTGAPDAAPVAEPVDAGILQGLLNALPVLINAKDVQSRYIFMNRFQARLYGVTPDEARGRTAEEMLGVGYGAYTRRLDRQVVETGRPTDFYEETYADAHGVVHDWMTQKVPLAGPDGRFLGVATIGMDITERKALERELVEARARAEAGNRAKSAFLAQMSHELRTPMNSLIGFAEIIAREQLGPVGDPRYAEYAHDVLHSAGILLDLINDLLDTAAIEAGRFALFEDWVSLEDLVRKVVNAQRLTAEKAGLEVGTMVAPNLPFVRADERRLAQALANLLSNSLKYTPAGGRVTIEAERDRHGDLALIVADTGHGMSEDDARRVFEPFVRLERAATSGLPGAGLGLPIAKAIVDAHGGTIRLVTGPGIGTRAVIRLPGFRFADGPDDAGRPSSP